MIFCTALLYDNPNVNARAFSKNVITNTFTLNNDMVDKELNSESILNSQNNLFYDTIAAPPRISFRVDL